ncbi:MAG: 2-oxoacid:acceptor oxidoreductase subunit alpha [Promethearchaeota archaeon]
MEWNVRVTGEAGQGVDTLARLLATTFARDGWHVVVANYVESRIRGGVNHSRVRASSSPVGCVRDRVDLLVALSREGLVAHAPQVGVGGLVVYDEEVVGAQEVPGVRGTTVGVDLARLAKNAGGTKVMANVVAAAIAACLVGLPDGALDESIRRSFHHDVEVNLKVASEARRFARSELAELSRTGGAGDRTPGKGADAGKPLLLLTGNEALAAGAVAAGCRFVAGYPMTPATSVLEFFFKRGDDLGLVAVQAESEVAAINLVVGASYAGARAMTATSGGGFDLMCEGLSFAAMAEVPVVVVNACRPGPSTGLPTRTDQSDLEMLLHAGHGEFPRFVFAPRDVADAFRVIRRAFDLSDAYQVPSLVLSDQHLSMSLFSVEEDDLDVEEECQTPRKAPTFAPPEAPERFRRYAADQPDGVSPWVDPGSSNWLVVASGDEHDEHGRYTEDPGERVKMQAKRMRKLKAMQLEVHPPVVVHPGGDPGTEPSQVIVGFGSTWGAAVEGAARLTEEGSPTAVVHFTDLCPFPAKGAAAALEPFRRAGIPLVLVEATSTGQLDRLLRVHLGHGVDAMVLRYDGRPFTVEDIVERVKRAVAGERGVQTPGEVR